MFRRFTKKRTAVALAAIAALALAVGAYAYLTASGSGSGSGDVSSTASNLTLSISNAPALTKIGDSQTYEISASNGGANPEHVSSINVTSIAPSAAAATAGCPGGSFSADTPTMTGNEVPAASGSTPGTAVVGHVTVHFNDVSAAQNGCLSGGAVAISLSSL